MESKLTTPIHASKDIRISRAAAILAIGLCIFFSYMATVKDGERLILVCMAFASAASAILLHISTKTDYTFDGQMIKVINPTIGSKRRFFIKDCVYYQKQVGRYGSRIYLHFRDGRGIYIPSDTTFFEAITERHSIQKKDRMLPYAKVAFAMIMLFVLSILIALWYFNTYDMPPRA